MTGQTQPQNGRATGQARRVVIALVNRLLVEAVQGDKEAEHKAFEFIQKHSISEAELRGEELQFSGKRKGWVLDEPAEAATPQWIRGPALIEEIIAHANDPWISLCIGGGELASVVAGGLVVLMGPSGAGKTSALAGMLVRHARDTGPAIALSRELPARQLAARTIGLQVDASWPDVLRGQVSRDHMRQALDLDRFWVLERKHATVDNLRAALASAREEYSGQPILGAVDYVQIVGAAIDDQRLRVSGAMELIDDLAREFMAVIIVVSQMSRHGARAARSGEAIGAATADLGAESAAIERWASVTISIGGLGPAAEDGSQPVGISVGKSRMGRGDVEYPCRYYGRSGDLRLDGDARPAAEVRAEKQAKRDDAAFTAALGAVRDAARRLTAPANREELAQKAGVKVTLGRAAVARLLAEGDLVEVQVRRSKSRSWLLWLRDRAEAKGIPIVDPTHVPEEG